MDFYRVFHSYFFHLKKKKKKLIGVTTESSPVAELSWWCWAGQDGSGCGGGMARGTHPSPSLAACDGCQGSSPAQRQDPLSPGCVCWRFLSPFGVEMGLPMGFASKLSLSSMWLQPVVSCSAQTSPFLPAAPLHPRGSGICLSSRPTPARQLPQNGFADLWQVLLSLAVLLLFISHLCYTAAPKPGHIHRQDCGRAGDGAGGEMLFLYLPTMLLF